MWCRAHNAPVLWFTVFFTSAWVVAPLPGGEEAQPGPDDRKAAIERILLEKTEIDATDLRLDQVIKGLSQRHNIDIQLDTKALADAGVAGDTTVTRQISDVTLRSALRLLLNELDLTYIVKHDVLSITTKAEAENIIEARVYPVADLVRPDPDFVGKPDPRQRGMLGARSRSDDNYGQLVEVITSTVRPESWDEGTGPSPIKELSSANCIVVPQTQEVHEEISQLLVALRAVREKQRPAVRAARRDPVPEPELELADQTLHLRVYDPRLYQVSYGRMMGMGGMGGGGLFQMGGASDQAGGSTGAGATTTPTPPAPDELRTRAKELADVVPEFVAVDSWESEGGEGRIRSCDGRLVVLQTDNVHRQVEEFLADFNGRSRISNARSSADFGIGKKHRWELPRDVWKRNPLGTESQRWHLILRQSIVIA